MYAPFNIPQVLVEARDRSPDAIAIQDGTGSTTVSYRHLTDDAEHWSRSMCEVVPAGHRIAVMMHGGVDLARWQLAVMWRHTLVPLRPDLSDVELRRCLTLTRTRVLLTDLASESLTLICRDLGIDIVTPQRLTCISPPENAQNPDTPTSHSTAVVLLTSGTTGSPKVVPLTHGNMLTSTRDMSRTLELTASDRALVMWSQYHIGGLIDSLLVPLSTGGTIVNGGPFMVESMIGLLESAQPTWTQFVPATLDETIRFSEHHGRSLTPNSLRFIRCVAAPVPEELWDRAQRILGCPLVHAYGMTEASPLVTATPLDITERVRGSTGRSVGPDIRIVDEHDQPVEPGIRGSIQIRGENVFAGYEGDVTLTSTAFVDGWFRTGDMGRLDARGELFVDGREKNLINRGGDKIAPAEIETVLRSHPSVIDAIVFPVPHRRLGHIVGAAVSTKDPIESHELIAHASRSLSPHKVPAEILTLGELPRIGVGKVDLKQVHTLWATRSVAEVSKFRNRTERIISEIWSDELGERIRSTTVSFSAVGGDSLSAIRVVAEVERIFAVTRGTDQLLASRTIRDMASTVESLARTGCAVLVTAARRQSARSGWNNQLTIDDLLGRIVRASPGLKRKVEEQLALTHLCPHEISQLVDKLRDHDDFDVNELYYLVKQGPSRLAAEMDPSLRADHEWTRTAGHEFVSIYRRNSASPASVTLIAFTGHAFRLLMPIHRLLSHLPPFVGSVILIVDPTQSFFASGVPGIAGHIAGLANGLVTAFPAECAGPLRTFGTSAGGLAAAVVGLELGARSVSVVGTDSSRRHPEIARELQLRATNAQVPCRAMCGITPRDLAGLFDMHRTFSRSTIRPYPTRRHNMLNEAWRRGRLQQAMNWLFQID